MKIDHIALYADNLALLRDFYMKYFNVECGDRYSNSSKQFTSYFLTFDDGATRIELMNIPDLISHEVRGNMRGLAHFAISVGSKTDVDALTARLRADGYQIISDPRTTGDGYYESVISDPEGNRIELTTY